MQKALWATLRKAFRENYLAAIGAVVLLLSSMTSSAQIFQYPNLGTYGTGQHRLSVDSVLYLPSQCGAPTGTADLHSYGFTGFGQKLKQIAILGDTCGHHVYWYDPTNSTWARLDGGGTGADSAVMRGSFTVKTSVGTVITIDVDTAALHGYFVRFSDSTVKYITPTQLASFAYLSAISTTNSVAGAGTPASPVQLVGDAAAPGNSFYYGTNGSGAKGYYSLPTGVAGANPTASIGFSPVNGTASTFTRSDAAPKFDTTALNIHTDGLNRATYKAITDSGYGKSSNYETVAGSQKRIDSVGGLLAGKQPTGNYLTGLSGDVTATGPGTVAATIANNAVTNAKAAQMGANTIKGNNTGVTANAADLTAAQVAAMLPTFTTTANGQVPSPGVVGGKVLSDNGTWVTSGASTTTIQQAFTNGNTFTQNNSFNQANHSFTFGGGGAVISDSLKMNSTSAFTPPTAMFWAGNSISNGVGASVQTNGFQFLYAAQQGLPYTNGALSGSGAWYSVGAIYSNVNPGHSFLGSYMFGLNDLRRDSVDNRVRTKILAGFGVAFYNHFLKVWYPANTSFSNIFSRSGTWLTYQGNLYGLKAQGSAMYTTTLNDSAQFKISADSTALIGFAGTDSTTGLIYSSKIYIYTDHVLTDSVSENNWTDGVSDGVNANHVMPFVFAKRGLSYGPHTITIVNKTSNPMVVDWVGNMTDKTYAYPLLIWDIPHMAAAGYSVAPYTFATPARIDTMNTQIRSFLGGIQAGYPVYYATTNSKYTATGGVDVYSDNIHPNDLGHREIDSAGLAALPKAVLLGTDGTIVRPGRLGQFYGGAFHLFASVDETVSNSPANGVAYLNKSSQTGDFYSTTLNSSGNSKVGNTLTAGSNGTTTSSNPSFRFFTGGTKQMAGYQFGGTNYFFSTDTTFTTGYPLTFEATSYTFGKYTGSLSNYLVLDPSATYTATLTGSLSASGKIAAGAPTTSNSSVNLAPSSAVNPTSPNDGDLWYNGTNLNFRHGGATSDLLSAAGGSSGTYVPTITNAASAGTIVSDTATWIRQGNIVTVDGHYQVAPASTTVNTQVYITLPVASLLSGGHALWGTSMTSQAPNGGIGGVLFTSGQSPNGAENTIYSTGSTSSMHVYYHFAYQVQ